MSIAIHATMTSIVDEEESVLTFLSIHTLAVIIDLAVSIHYCSVDFLFVRVDERHYVFLEELEASEPLSHHLDILHSLIKVSIGFTS